jgi:hypothetical protein
VYPFAVVKSYPAVISYSKTVLFPLSSTNNFVPSALKAKSLGFVLSAETSTLTMGPICVIKSYPAVNVIS